MINNAFITAITHDAQRRTLTMGDNSVTLNRQTSECLRLLVANKDRLITKEMILDECWHKHGLVVSDASVRQALFQLRKALTAVGLPAGSLITEPRKGYRLASDLIFTVSTECLLPVVVDNAEITEPVRRFRPLSFVLKRLAHPAVIIIAALALSLLAGFVKLNQVIVPVHYIPVANIANMHILSKEGGVVDAKRLHLQLLNYQRLHYISLPHTPWIYVNDTDQNATLSAFICNAPIQHKSPRCSSLTLVRTSE